MLARLARPFQIKTRTEAFGVIYALAVGAVERGEAYLVEYPGPVGYVFAAICTLAVFMAGGKLLDSVRAPADAVSTPDPRISKPCTNTYKRLAVD